MSLDDLLSALKLPQKCSPDLYSSINKALSSSHATAAPLAMRIVNTVTTTLTSPLSSDKENVVHPKQYHDFLLDSALCAISTLEKYELFVNLKPLDLEKATSNLLTKVIDAGMYTRALTELCHLRERLESYAQTYLTPRTSTNRPAKTILPASNSSRITTRSVRTSKPAARDTDRTSTRERTRTIKPSPTSHSLSTEKTETVIKQHYSNLFLFDLNTLQPTPLKPPVTRGTKSKTEKTSSKTPPIRKPADFSTFILLLLALKINAARCWIETNNLILLERLPHLLLPSTSPSPSCVTAWDWCAKLKDLDSIAGNKQFDTIFRLIYRAAAKPECNPPMALNLRLCALEFYSCTDAGNVASIADYAARFLAAFDKGTNQKDYIQQFSIAHHYCERVLKILQRKSLEENGGGGWDKVKKDVKFVTFCELWGGLARKAGNSASALLAYESMTRDINPAMPLPESSSNESVNETVPESDESDKGTIDRPGDTMSTKDCKNELVDAISAANASTNVATIVIDKAKSQNATVASITTIREKLASTCHHLTTLSDILCPRSCDLPVANNSALCVISGADSTAANALIRFLRSLDSLRRGCVDIEHEWTTTTSGTRREEEPDCPKEKSTDSNRKLETKIKTVVVKKENVTLEAKTKRITRTTGSKVEKPVVSGTRSKRNLETLKSNPDEEAVKPEAADESLIKEKADDLFRVVVWGLMHDMLNFCKSVMEIPSGDPAREIIDHLLQKSTLLSLDIHTFLSRLAQNYFISPAIPSRSPSPTSTSRGQFQHHLSEALSLARSKHAPFEALKWVSSACYNCGGELYKKGNHQDAIVVLKWSKDALISFLDGPEEETCPGSDEQEKARALLVKRCELLGVCAGIVGDNDEALSSYKSALQYLPASEFEALAIHDCRSSISVNPSTSTPEPLQAKTLIERYVRTSHQRIKIRTHKNGETESKIAVFTPVYALVREASSRKYSEAVLGAAVECEMGAILDCLASSSADEETSTTLTRWCMECFEHLLTGAYVAGGKFPIRRARILLELAKFKRSFPRFTTFMFAASNGYKSRDARDCCEEAIEILKLDDFGEDQHLARLQTHLGASGYAWLGICCYDTAKARDTAEADRRRLAYGDSDSEGNDDEYERGEMLVDDRSESRPTKMSKSFNMALRLWRKCLTKMVPFGMGRATRDQIEETTLAVEDVERLYSLFQLLRDLFSVCETFVNQILVCKLMLRLNNGLRSSVELGRADSVDALTSIGQAYLKLGYTGKAGLAFAKAKTIIDSFHVGTTKGEDRFLGRSATVRVWWMLAYCQYLTVIGNSEKSDAVFREVEEMYGDLMDMSENGPVHAKGALSVPFQFPRSSKQQNRTVLAYASFVRSGMALRMGCLDDAIRDASRSMRLLNRIVFGLTRKRRNGIRQSAENEEDGEENPFIVKEQASDDETKTSQKEQETEHESLVRCSQWDIATKLMDCLAHLALLYTLRGSVREAEYFYMQGLHLARISRSQRAIRRFLLSEAEVEYRKASWVESEAHINEAIELAREDDGKEGQESRNVGKESAVARLRAGDLSFRRHGLEQALVAYREGEDILTGMMDESFISGLEKLEISGARTPRESRMIRSPPSKTPLTSRYSESAIQFECFPLNNMKAELFCRSGWVMSKQGQLEDGERLIEHGKAVNPSAQENAEYHLTVARIKLLTVCKKLTKMGAFTTLLDSVLTLPLHRKAPAKVVQTTTSKTRVNRSKPPAIQKDIEAALEHLQEAYRFAYESAVPQIFHDVCLFLTFSTMIQAYCAPNTPVSQLEETSLKCAFYMEMAKGLTTRREMLAKLRTNLYGAENDMKWPLAIFKPTEEQSDAVGGTDGNWEDKEAKLRHLSELYSHEGDMTYQTFGKQFLDPLPSSWTVCSISMDVERQDLYICRLRRGVSPTVLRLPLRRHAVREGEEESKLSYERVLEEMKTILQASDASTKKGPQLTTREDKLAWWKERKGLDERLKMFLDDLESAWLGGFKGILVAHEREEGDLAAILKLKSRLEGLIFEGMGGKPGSAKTKKLEVDVEMVRCFIRLGPDPSTEEIEDALYCLADGYQYSGFAVDYAETDFDVLAYDFRELLQKHHSNVTPQKPNGDENATSPYDPHMLLLLDKNLQSLPWENLPILRRQPVTRLPALSFLRDRILLAEWQAKEKENHGETRCIDTEIEGSGPDADADSDLRKFVTVRPEKGFYVLNPSGDLKNTQSSFEEFLDSFDGWQGATGHAPTEREYLAALEHNDIFVYFGHGGGEQYVRGQAIRQLDRCAVTLLMGCSSGLLKSAGEFDPLGTVLNYIMAGSPATVANLWDVTDKDIDRFSAGVFEEWGLTPGPDSNDANQTGDAPKPWSPSLAQAVMKSRERCTLKYLIGASPVVYGIPVYLDRPSPPL